MKYLGSKVKIADEILSIILKNRTNELYIEPFCGGCNVIDKVSNPRQANDINFYLIEMFKEIVYNNWTPYKINKELYNEIKNHKYKFDPHLVGWTGFNCSYSGKFFGGFAGDTLTKTGIVRDYQTEAIRNLIKQRQNLFGVEFTNLSYYELDLNNTIVYCDPPYYGTTHYNNNIDHDQFWEWVRDISKDNQVYVSEYRAPSDFECIWTKTVKSSLSANGKYGGSKSSIEKLFRFKY